MYVQKNIIELLALATYCIHSKSNYKDDSLLLLALLGEYEPGMNVFELIKSFFRY